MNPIQRGVIGYRFLRSPAVRLRADPPTNDYEREKRITVLTFGFVGGIVSSLAAMALWWATTGFGFR